jgi:archaellin
MEKNRDTMNNEGNLGLIAGMLLIGFLLIGAVSASVIMNTTQDISEKDLNTVTKEVIDDLCSYIKIKFILGQYQTINGEQRIQHVAVQITPLVSQDIDLKKLTLQVSDETNIYFSSFNGAAFIGSSFCFTTPSGKPALTNLRLHLFNDDDTSMISNISSTKTQITLFLLSTP